MVRSLPVACVALLLVGACERRPEPQPSAPAAQAPPAFKANVTVLNADVLVIDGKHLRLGVYAPQPVPDARCWAEALAAKQATRTVAAMVQRATTVTSTLTGKVDEYDRAYANVLLDGADLGQTLIAEGMAAEPHDSRFEWCDPVSRNEPGAPKITTMMETSPGRAP